MTHRGGHLACASTMVMTVYLRVHFLHKLQRLFKTNKKQTGQYDTTYNNDNSTVQQQQETIDENIITGGGGVAVERDMAADEEGVDAKNKKLLVSEALLILKNDGMNIFCNNKNEKTEAIMNTNSTQGYNKKHT